ncbi:GNAT family N-acetyltransferase [Gordonibacter sp. 28C]|uniref:GNAT family N-acetyltransferase n=1 Tax=Gordonibacter sp. 28C TaxID=2078569 RepID=UPI000DF7A46C|nr:GNAT family N-acetyltransferase [Gordonibacter sp. 28C]RDB59308.1 GNAT family N-acetyltransferase [Gordonibacter sp. 28C]
MEYRFEQGNFADARIVRTRVFMEEQGFENEFDDVDESPDTVHVTMYDADGALVGCARTFPDPDHADEPGRWVFGRLAVLPEARHGGRGAALLAESERLARAAGAVEMHLHAQCRVTSFYERVGYEQYGPVELDEHVEHIWMRKTL